MVVEIERQLSESPGKGGWSKQNLLPEEWCVMEIEGVVQNGVIVPDDATSLSEGTRVRITPVPSPKARPFGQRFAQFKGAVPSLPVDLAQRHEHYRLGTPKR